ncbi:TonB-dependent receptor plug domain-containing protein [Bizionia paragorgiae]|uniref:Outer membrane receptor for ferrienterochelin and colicins n=1 Tax=Bizionia paragorgiae TaxID=283786 RepID=A0A1H3YYJ3_BIZPA|nr:TonB-dependent receptor [Bizionia paragorgiae]SEA16589.1 outer membrane receptor for ferrienterochelin and colicins [Bizionia paragorgiae]
MSLNKNYNYTFLLFFLSLSCFSQSIAKDSTQAESLREVIITGQYNPQSIKKSIHNVTVIKREQIESQAANNLADLLNFNLNLTVIPNSLTGKSTVSFFGLDSQYFNILVDNIPLVSDNGLGNNIDLTQINLDDIERIEIAEGAMGVEYGANAVSGVINIITKKSIDTDWAITASVQEETISDEYEWFNEGRHIQSLSVAHNINNKLLARVGVNRNQFAGFFNGKQGRDYYKNDGLRGYDWQPKAQINTNGLLNYKLDHLTVTYKFEYLNEVLNFYDASVRQNIDVVSQTSNPLASDRIFTTNRFINNLNVNGHLESGANYSAAFSYQTQKRDLNKFTYFILSGDKTNETDDTYQSSEVFFTKGRINNLVKSDFYNFELGYEARYIKGYDTQASGDITKLEKERSQSNYAAFASTELNVTNTLSLRPGVRYEYNSKFKSKVLASFSARYLLNNGFELRGNVGTSYRTPNFEELYYYFVDSNHDVQGNENLNPEKGFSAFLNLKKRSWFNDISLVNALKLSYIDVEDKIDLAIINASPLQYQYINIDAYKLWSISLENTIKKGHWAFNLGATLQGASRIANNEVNAVNDFLYSFQVNTSGTYAIENWDTALTILLKYNGEQKDYVATGMDTYGNSLFSKSSTEGYSWLDASIKKSFLNNTIQATIGGRNLLDVTNVNISTQASGGAHSVSNNSLLLGYGRSYYLKLLYNLNF